MQEPDLAWLRARELKAEDLVAEIIPLADLQEIYHHQPERLALKLNRVGCEPGPRFAPPTQNAER